MKKLFVFLIAALYYLISYSQGNIEYHLSIVDNYNKPISNLKVKAVEINTLTVTEATSNSMGKVDMKLTNGSQWVINIGEMDKCVYLDAVKYSIIEMNQTFVYDLKDYYRRKLQSDDRDNSTYQLIKQNNTAYSKFSDSECLLIISIKDERGTLFSGINVNIVNNRDSVIYNATTVNGKAYFVIPNNNKYDIDINEYKNFNYCDFDNQSYTSTLTLDFFPTIVNEVIKNDTVYQNVNQNGIASSARAFIKIKVSRNDNDITGETIYLNQLNSDIVYVSKVNNNGFAYFLLPTRKIYMINFKFQKNVDVVNLANSKGRTNGEYSLHYIPDPKLEFPEKFIPAPDQLLIKEFNEFLTTQFEKPKDKSFTLNIRSAKKLNAESKEALFMLTLAGSDTYVGKKIPLNLAFVLDKSGSMYYENRGEALKKSLWEIGNELTNNDIISVILFETSAYGVQHSYSNHLIGFENIIENYTPGGTTNILEGLKIGAEYIMKDYDDQRANKIILLTDGYGDNPPKEITDFVEQKFSEGIEFSAIGLGDNFNQALLELIALKGNGTFSYVDSSSYLSQTFLKEVKNALMYVAKDIKFTITFPEQLSYSQLYGFPIKSATDNTIIIEINKIPQSFNKIAFLKFKTTNLSKEIENEALIVEASYFDMNKNQSVTYTQNIKFEWTEESNTELLLNQEEKTLYAIAILNQSLKLMADAFAIGDNKSAKQALKSGIEQTKNIFPGVKPKEVKKLFDEAYHYVELFDQIEKNKF